MRVNCPVEGYGERWIDVPDEWLGKHAAVRDAAVAAAKDKELSATSLNFAVSVALLDDFNLPGLEGRPEHWQFDDISLRVISWVNNEVLPPFNFAERFPALSYPRLPIGLPEKVTTIQAPGDSEEE